MDQLSLLVEQPVREKVAPPPDLGPAFAAQGIPLKRRDGTVRAFVRVDAEDDAWARQYKWHLHTLGYAARNLARPETGTALMHREILERMGTSPSEVSDHVNRNRLDNRRSNLRACTQAENLQNQPSRPGAKSAHRGVTKVGPALKARGCKKEWVAKVQKDRKVITVGYFNTELEAAEAAKAWRSEHMPFSNE